MNTKVQQNISDELFDQWKKHKRQGDGIEIANKLEITAPTVTRALKYGYVSKTYLADAITKFFMDRMESEKADAGKLEQLSSQTQN